MNWKTGKYVISYQVEVRNRKLTLEIIEKNTISRLFMNPPLDGWRLPLIYTVIAPFIEIFQFKLLTFCQDINRNSR